MKPSGSKNYGLPQLTVKDAAATTTVTLKNAGGLIHSAANALIIISMKGRKIPSGKAIGGVAYPSVSARNAFCKGEVADQKETLMLILYGCSELKIVAFPVMH